MLALKLTGHKGTSAPGKLAIRLCPDILSRFGKRTKRDIIAVLGTNGKTTTNNIIADCLEAQGYSVVCNRVGANMDEGAATAYIEKCGLFGSLDADYACLELDEGWAEFVFKYITPTKIIVTNLFRDQLDRYGELGTTMEFIRRAIRLAPEALLILNGDEPICVRAAEPLENKKLYYGIEKPFSHNESALKEGKFCYNCGRELEYEFRHFGQLGKYSCSCGFCRPALSYTAEGITAFPNVEFTVPVLGEISFGGRGSYNIYNALACIAVCDRLGLPFDTVRRALKAYKPQIGRMEEFKICGKDVYLILAKNPSGFNRSVESVNEDPRTRDIVIAVNDGIGDGRDVSWIWEVEFEELMTSAAKSFSVSGTRYADMALRLKYAGLERDKIALSPDIKERLSQIVRGGGGETVYVLANYTALFGAQEVLKELSVEYGN